MVINIADNHKRALTVWDKSGRRNKILVFLLLFSFLAMSAEIEQVKKSDSNRNVIYFELF